MRRPHTHVTGQKGAWTAQMRTVQVLFLSSPLPSPSPAGKTTLDKPPGSVYDLYNFIAQTDDVKITSVVHSQRVRAAESRAGRRQANGSRRARSKATGRVFRDVGAYVSCRGYVGIPQSARLSWP